MKYNINGREIEFITISENPNNYTIFRHFKNKDYAILTIAKDCETLTDIVVYKALYLPDTYWTREASEFFSLLDREKYPDLIQKYIFEKVN